MDLSNSNGEFGAKAFEKYNAIKELYDLIKLKLPLTPQEHKNWQSITHTFFDKVYTGKVDKSLLKLFELKRCKVCGNIKPYISFYNSMSVCITCYNKRRKNDTLRGNV